MSKTVLKELPELLEAGIITDDVADKIKLHYQSKENQSNRLVIVFGILGAILTGLGVILIVAHNWDNLSRELKLFLAFFPLLVGQVLCFFTLLKKNEKAVWREVTTVFLFFSIAASISIVSQVYNIHGDLAGFLLIWMVLSIPMLYIMKSRMTSLLVIACITWYALVTSFDRVRDIQWNYWFMTASIIPFFLHVIKMQGKNFLYLHMWMLSLSLLIGFYSFEGPDANYLIIGYMSLFCGYILLGGQRVFSNGKLISNAFLIIGSLGCIVLLLSFTFKWPWENISRHVSIGRGFMRAQ